VGQRMYRSGDFGRWLADGKLEFLGRRDAQVKISGFRIELGEIESTLLRVPGVRDAAVVVCAGSNGATRLVGFYSGERALDAAMVRALLNESLPDYMVPSAIHWRLRMPLTENGKIDRKALTALAGNVPFVEGDRDRLTSDTEHRLAATWAEVLGIPKAR